MRTSSVWQAVGEHAPGERRLVLPVAGGQSAGGTLRLCMELDSAGGAAALSPMQKRDGRWSRGAGRLQLVRSEGLVGTAGDARIRRRAGAECRKGIDLGRRC